MLKLLIFQQLNIIFKILFFLKKKNTIDFWKFKQKKSFSKKTIKENKETLFLIPIFRIWHSITQVSYDKSERPHITLNWNTAILSKTILQTE